MSETLEQKELQRIYERLIELEEYAKAIEWLRIEQPYRCELAKLHNVN